MIDPLQINSVKTTRLPIMNEIEVKSATFVNKYFPTHFHKAWSLGYIESGSEYISFNATTILMSKGTSILIPPYSLHKNWGAKNSVWTYKAIYIESDLIQTLCKNLNLDYLELASFPYFINHDKLKFEVKENTILDMLQCLLLSKNNNHTFSYTPNSNKYYLNELLDYLTVNFNEKITLDSLEKEFKINKFKLLRRFKTQVGISPLEYQMSIRIEKSKQLFFEDTPLTHIALDSGFFDQSHFTHNFKKYVGITPGDFKSNCNILQDQESYIA